MLKMPSKQLLELINESDKLTGDKFNIQESVPSLHTNNKLSARGIKETV